MFFIMSRSERQKYWQQFDFFMDKESALKGVVRLREEMPILEWCVMQLVEE